MTSPISDEVFTAFMGFLIPALGGWIWKIQTQVSQHEEVIKKVDQLVSILLNDRLKA